MKRGRNLVVSNLVGLLLLVMVYAAGWREAAAFGLAVLLMMNVIVLVRERPGRSSPDSGEDSDV